MRKQELNRVQEVLIEIDSLRGILRRLDMDTFSGQERAHNISNLINNVYKTELESIMRDMVTNPENSEAA